MSSRLSFPESRQKHTALKGIKPKEPLILLKRSSSAIAINLPSRTKQAAGETPNPVIPRIFIHTPRILSIRSKLKFFNNASSLIKADFIL